jgi:hypothetical protein
MIDRHVADLAELYALGVLDDDARAAVDAHLQHCPSCAAFIASAERDVALIASMESRLQAPPELQGRIERLVDTGMTLLPERAYARKWTLPAALAAALIVGLLPSVYFWSENRSMHGAMLTQSAAIERVAGAPHRTTAFHVMPGGSPADVMYAPDGSWYVVVVRGSSRPLSVAWMHDGTHTMLGDAIPRGNIAMLYLPKSHRMDRLALMDGDRVVAEAALSWRKTALSRRGARSG